MKSPSLAYAAPATLAELWELLGGGLDGTALLAGGQSLLPRLARRELHVTRLIDLGRIPELDVIETGATGTRIGAGVTQRDAERSEVLARRHPLLRAALAYVATPQVRARGTVGGSLAHGDPSAELPASLVALDATAVIASPTGTRRLPLEALYLGPCRTALARDEVLVAVELPSALAGWRDEFDEVARRAVDVAVAGVAVRVRSDADGQVLDCRVVCAGVAPTPRRLPRVETLVRTAGLAPTVLDEVVDLVMADVDPTDDGRASASYRRWSTAVLVRRCLAKAADPGARRAA